MSDEEKRIGQVSGRWRKYYLSGRVRWCGWGAEKRDGRLGKVVHTSSRARDKASHM